MQPSYLRGFRDIYAGVVPSVPGLYVLNDVYHYAGNANALMFNGAVQLGVEAKFTADFLPITYVTKWKILGGTYAFGVAPAASGHHLKHLLGLGHGSRLSRLWRTGLRRQVPRQLQGVPAESAGGNFHHRSGGKAEASATEESEKRRLTYSTSF